MVDFVTQYSLPTILGAILILFFIVIAVALKIRGNNNNKKGALEFLGKLEQTIVDTIVKTISSFDPNDYDSLEEFEASVLSSIYDNCWDCAISEAKLAFYDNMIMEAVLNIIDKDMVISFVDDLINKRNISDKIANIYASNNIEKFNIEDEDKELADKFSNQEEYVEDSSNDDLEPAEEVLPTAEEIAELNPPKEEEDTSYNVEDDSTELITDKPTIIVSKDKNGNELYYEVSSDGKKKRVSKSYAEAHM